MIFFIHTLQRHASAVTEPVGVIPSTLVMVHRTGNLLGNERGCHFSYLSLARIQMSDGACQVDSSLWWSDSCHGDFTVKKCLGTCLHVVVLEHLNDIVVLVKNDRLEVC